MHFVAENMHIQCLYAIELSLCVVLLFFINRQWIFMSLFESFTTKNSTWWKLCFFFFAKVYIFFYRSNYLRKCSYNFIFVIKPVGTHFLRMLSKEIVNLHYSLSLTLISQLDKIPNYVNFELMMISIEKLLTEMWYLSSLSSLHVLELNFSVEKNPVD